MRRTPLRLVVAAAVVGCLLGAEAGPAPAETRAIRFPVEGHVTYRDDFGEPRPGGRTHQGIDIFGNRLQRLLAATDATVVQISVDSGISGNLVKLRDAAGWEYWYIHLNNDSPGTDDGANPPQWRFAPGLHVGQRVSAGQFIGYLGDSGNAEWELPQLHFEIRRPDGRPINPFLSLRDAAGHPPTPRWYLRNSAGGGAAQLQVPYGLVGDQPLACDWDGNGSTTIGIIRPGEVHLRNDLAAGAGAWFPYGSPGDRYVCGDWDGNGTDTIGVYRSGAFHLRNSNDAGAAQVVVGYGNPGDQPVVGDWDGDSRDTIGIFRGGAFYLRNSLTTGVADVTFAYGNPDDRPFAGDWDGDGRDSIGISRSGAWFLRNTNTTGIADVTAAYGDPGDLPVVGDWDGDGDTTLGVYRMFP